MTEIISETTSRLDHRVKTLRSYADAVNNVISAATTCGSTFQHAVERERINFSEFLDESPSSGPIDDEDYLTGLTSFFESMEKFGQAFASLAASLTFHTAEPLLALSKELAHLKEDVEDKLWLHEKQVEDCQRALSISKLRQVQANADLETWEQERKDFDSKKNKTLISQLFSKQTTIRLDRKLRNALTGQHAATDEVAVRAQAVDLALKQSQITYSDLFAMIHKAETHLCHRVVTSLTAVAGAVEENVEAVRVAAENACVGAQFIRRALNAEDSRAVPTPRSHFKLNPFADDDILRTPDGKLHVHKNTTKSGASSSDEESESAHMSTIPEESASEQYRKSSKTRGWWNEMDARSHGISSKISAASSRVERPLPEIYRERHDSRGSSGGSLSSSAPVETEHVAPPTIVVYPATSELSSITDGDSATSYQRYTQPSYAFDSSQGVSCSIKDGAVASCFADRCESQFSAVSAKSETSGDARRKNNKVSFGKNAVAQDGSASDTSRTKDAFSNAVGEDPFPDGAPLSDIPARDDARNDALREDGTCSDAGKKEGDVAFRCDDPRADGDPSSDVQTDGALGDALRKDFASSDRWDDDPFSDAPGKGSDPFCDAPRADFDPPRNQFSTKRDVVGDASKAGVAFDEVLGKGGDPFHDAPRRDRASSGRDGDAPKDGDPPGDWPRGDFDPFSRAATEGDVISGTPKTDDACDGVPRKDGDPPGDAPTTGSASSGGKATFNDVLIEHGDPTNDLPREDFDPFSGGAKGDASDAPKVDDICNDVPTNDCASSRGDATFSDAPRVGGDPSSDAPTMCDGFDRNVLGKGDICSDAQRKDDDTSTSAPTKDDVYSVALRKDETLSDAPIKDSNPSSDASNVDLLCASDHNGLLRSHDTLDDAVPMRNGTPISTPLACCNLAQDETTLSENALQAQDAE